MTTKIKRCAVCHVEEVENNGTDVIVECVDCKSMHLMTMKSFRQHRRNGYVYGRRR